MSPFDAVALSTGRIVLASIVVLSALVFLLSLVVLVHHAASDRRRRNNRRRFVEATNVLLPVVMTCRTTDELMEAVLEARDRFGRRAVMLVLRETRNGLRGEAAQRVSEVLERTGTVAAVAAGLSSKREWVRLTAVKALGECGGATARQALSLAMNDRSSEVRSAAREALISDGSFGAVHAAINAFLHDPDKTAPQMRSFYARLATHAPGELLELLRKDVLTGADRKWPLEALGDAEVQQALPIALMHVSDRDAELRASAARVLGRIGTAGELAVLPYLLADPVWFVRAAAARAVAALFDRVDRAATSSLCELLALRVADDSWWVRANAARALARAGERGAMLLLHVAEGDDRYARDTALATLAVTPMSDGGQARFRIALKRTTPSAVPQTTAVPPTIHPEDWKHV